MPWARIDDKLWNHRRVRRLPRRDRFAAIGLWTLGLSLANHDLTDGALSAEALADLGATERLTDALVAVGLWEYDGVGGVRIRDFLDYSESADEVRARRAANADRQRKFRESRVSHALVTAPRPVPSRPNPSLSKERVRDSATARLAEALKVQYAAEAKE